MKANICQQIKKDSCDGSNVNYLETQSSTGEEKEQEYKPVVNGVHSRVDNQSADNTYNNNKTKGDDK